VDNRLVLAGCVDQQGTGQVGSDRVGKELVEIGVKDAIGSYALVLDIPDEAAARAFPPRDVWLEANLSPAIQPQPMTTVALRERAFGEPQLLAERNDDEVLEDLVHVDQECARPDAAVGEVERRRPQDQPGQLDGRTVAVVEPGPGDLRNPSRIVLDRSYGAECLVERAQRAAGCHRAKA
jgi:hypothetical protein